MPGVMLHISEELASSEERTQIQGSDSGDGSEALRRSNVHVRCDLRLNDESPVETARECDIWLHRGHLITWLSYGIEGMRVGGRRRIRTSLSLHMGIQVSLAGFRRICHLL